MIAQGILNKWIGDIWALKPEEECGESQTCHGTWYSTHPSAAYLTDAQTTPRHYPNWTMGEDTLYRFHKQAVCSSASRLAQCHDQAYQSTMHQSLIRHLPLSCLSRSRVSISQIVIPQVGVCTQEFWKAICCLVCSHIGYQLVITCSLSHLKKSCTLNFLLHLNTVQKVANEINKRSSWTTSVCKTSAFFQWLWYKIIGASGPVRKTGVCFPCSKNVQNIDRQHFYY